MLPLGIELVKRGVKIVDSNLVGSIGITKDVVRGVRIKMLGRINLTFAAGFLRESFIVLLSRANKEVKIILERLSRG